MELTTGNIDRAKELRSMVGELNDLILNGQMMDGFEKYYSESIVMQENDGDAIVGKE
ncbi:MAG: hypothetical protein HKN43_02745 [Rhodothermales bacterium]|nr:hypothetical protein [Rhodothermales bacterium]